MLRCRILTDGSPGTSGGKIRWRLISSLCHEPNLLIYRHGVHWCSIGLAVCLTRVAGTERHHKDVREQSSGLMRSDLNDHHWELRFPQMFGQDISVGVWVFLSLGADAIRLHTGFNPAAPGTACFPTSGSSAPKLISKRSKEISDEPPGGDGWRDDAY